jgi:hypothetical protein
VAQPDRADRRARPGQVDADDLIGRARPRELD